MNYLGSHNVGSCEGGHSPVWDHAAYDGPDQAEDPEGHTYNLNSNRSHSGNRTSRERKVLGMRVIITAVTTTFQYSSFCCCFFFHCSYMINFKFYFKCVLLFQRRLGKSHPVFREEEFLNLFHRSKM